MKRARSFQRLPFLLLLSCPLLSAADLSSYRGFQFGMSLSAAAKHSGMDLSEATVIHERRARIQELNWRPLRFSSRDTDPVEQVLFDFYNGQLFRMVVDYDTGRTTGLTSQDMIDAVSAKFGASTNPGGTIVLGQQSSNDRLDDQIPVLARWEDAEYSLNLVQLPYGSTYKLLIFSKRLDALAHAALLEAARLDTAEAPQREKSKEQDAQGELAKSRVLNKGNFRP